MRKALDTHTRNGTSPSRARDFYVKLELDRTWPNIRSSLVEPNILNQILPNINVFIHIMVKQARSSFELIYFKPEIKLEPRPTSRFNYSLSITVSLITPFPLQGRT